MPIHTVGLVVEHRPDGAYITVDTPNGPASVGPLDLSKTQALTAIGQVVKPKERTGAKKTQRRRSMRQEEEIAAREGGTRVKGSGAGRTKGDVRVKGLLRLEAKYTKARSFVVRQEELAKIRAEATNLELPVFEIHFVDPITTKTYDRWMLVDARFFDMMEYKPAYATTLD